MLELLSPAGSPEAVRAAVQSGADAIYLGYGNFNARRNAVNFDETALQEAVQYCHLRGVKVSMAALAKAKAPTVSRELGS